MKNDPRIALDVVDGFTLSTVAAHGNLVRHPETCLFVPGKQYGRSSKVLQVYDTDAEALTGHTYWLGRLQDGTALPLLEE